LLGDGEWRVARKHWGLDGPPNFENAHWHLRVARQLEPAERPTLSTAREKLFAHRETRIHPGRDDKVLTAWNALMIEGLAHAGRVFGRPDWLAAARRAMACIQVTLRDGYLDDYAFLLLASQELQQAAPQAGDPEFAVKLGDALLERFEDKEDGGFYFTANDHEALIHRPKPGHDNSMPGGNAAAALALLRLARLTGEVRYRDAAERALRLFQPQLARTGGGTATLLMALAEALAGPSESVNILACTDVACSVPDGVIHAG
jgi:hypothetical protein